MKKITVKRAAELMGVSAQYIRVGLQKEVLPFGCALKVGGDNYSYYISPAKFSEYTGIGIDTILGAESESLAQEA